jgi:hypothetical protein
MGSIFAHGQGSSALSGLGWAASAETIPAALPTRPPATKAAPSLRNRLREHDARLMSSPMLLSLLAAAP